MSFELGKGRGGERLGGTCCVSGLECNGDPETRLANAGAVAVPGYRWGGICIPDDQVTIIFLLLSSVVVSTGRATELPQTRPAIELQGDRDRGGPSV